MKRTLAIVAITLAATVPGTMVIQAVFEPEQKEVSRRSVEECIKELIDLDKLNHNTTQESKQ